MAEWPSHSAMVAMSTPAWRRFIAQVCRRTCGDTCLPLRERQLDFAAVTCLASRHWIASTLSGRPCLVGERGLRGSAGPLAQPGAQHGEAEQRMDRGEPGVAGAHAVASVVFEMGQERHNEFGVEIGDVQPARPGCGALLREAE